MKLVELEFQNVGGGGTVCRAVVNEIVVWRVGFAPYLYTVSDRLDPKNTYHNLDPLMAQAVLYHLLSEVADAPR